MTRRAVPGWSTASLLAAAACMRACASAPRDAGFASVRHTVEQQGGHDLRWSSPESTRTPDTLQPPPDRPLTADDAVQVALLNNPSLQALFQSLGIARGDLIDAGTLRNPALAARVRWSSHVSSANPELALLFDVTDLLRRGKRPAVARANLDLAILEVSNAVLQFSAEVRHAYLEYAAAENMRRMRREVVEAADAAAQLANRQREAGNVNAIAVSMARGAFQEARLELTRSKNESALARLELARLMGIASADSNWAVASELPPIPDADPPVETLEAIAVTARLDLQAAQKRIDAGWSELSYRKTFTIPLFEVGVEAERDFDHQWAVGPSLQISVPLFDRGQGGVHRATAMLRQAQHGAAALENDVRFDLRAAHTRMRAAREAVETYRDDVLPTRESIVAESQKHYTFMLVGAITLLQAKRDEIDAYRGYIEAVRDYWIARSDLERAVAA